MTVRVVTMSLLFRRDGTELFDRKILFSKEAREEIRFLVQFALDVANEKGKGLQVVTHADDRVLLRKLHLLQIGMISLEDKVLALQKMT